MARVSRRQFGVAAAMAGVGAAQSGPPHPSLPAQDEAAVEAKYAEVVRKYGTRLTAEQRTRVSNTLVEHQRMLMRIRGFALENSDAPATGFDIYPKPTQP